VSAGLYFASVFNNLVSAGCKLMQTSAKVQRSFMFS